MHPARHLSPVRAIFTTLRPALVSSKPGTSALPRRSPANTLPTPPVSTNEGYLQCCPVWIQEGRRLKHTRPTSSCTGCKCIGVLFFPPPDSQRTAHDAVLATLVSRLSAPCSHLSITYARTPVFASARRRGDTGKIPRSVGWAKGGARRNPPAAHACLSLPSGSRIASGEYDGWMGCRDTRPLCPFAVRSSLCIEYAHSLPSFFPPPCLVPVCVSCLALEGVENGLQGGVLAWDPGQKDGG
ncbi:hypothetical protein B0H19DRAFT_1243539 [Mycena capillaripes]|nr:hypothetical protein B0H19DRAFT_1243539 [Mycena capillaripes]